MTDETTPSEAGAATGVTPEQLQRIGAAMVDMAHDLAALVGPVTAARMLMGLAATFVATHQSPWATAAELKRLSVWLAQAQRAH